MDVLPPEARLPQPQEAIVVEVGIVRAGPRQDLPVGAAALQAGRVEAERQLVLAPQVDADLDVVEEPAEEVAQHRHLLRGVEPAVAVLGAEDGGRLPLQLPARGLAQPGTHRLHVGLGAVAERRADAVALARGHGVGGEPGVVRVPAERRVKIAVRPQPAAVGSEEALQRRGAGLLGSDLEDRPSAHGPLPRTRRRS